MLGVGEEELGESGNGSESGRRGEWGRELGRE